MPTSIISQRAEIPAFSPPVAAMGATPASRRRASLTACLLGLAGIAAAQAVEPPPLLPTILQQPASQTVAAGHPAIFTVAALGAPDLRLPLWPAGTPPGAAVVPDTESYAASGTVSNVTKPTIAVYLANPAAATGTAVIICSGGGYHTLDVEKLGGGACAYLNRYGITVISLKYRLSPPSTNTPGDMVADGERALRLVRSHAAEWHINPARVGMAGYSAGANLILNLTAAADAGNPAAADAVERFSSRPDFIGLFSTWPNGQTVAGIAVPASAPPAYIGHAEDDPIAPYTFSTSILATWTRLGIPAQFESQPTGNHTAFLTGTGLHGDWPTRFVPWLAARGLTTAAIAAPATDRPGLTYQWQRNGATIVGATHATWTLPAVAAADNGAVYRCLVYSPAGKVSSTGATLTVGGTTGTTTGGSTTGGGTGGGAVAPAITTQPAPRTVTVGQTATFTIAATGSPTPSFQWQKNGLAITGATAATYTTPAAVAADNGATYRCVATNSAGAATSAGAVLTVTTTGAATIPVITTQPQSATVAVGATATYSVIATGTPAPSFQWQRNGANIAGATAATYTTPAVLATDNGKVFRCLVTNSAGTAKSGLAYLTVTTGVVAKSANATEGQEVSLTRSGADGGGARCGLGAGVAALGLTLLGLRRRR